jgi:protein-disulfide isomerase
MNEPKLTVGRRELIAGLVAGIGPTSSFAQSADEAYAQRLLAAAPEIGERSLGSATAFVTVIEYASATCPHCAQFHLHTFPQIRRHYIDTGKVRWIFRELPLDDAAMAAFMLARCLPESKYFQTLANLFKQQKIWAGPETRRELSRIMREAGMSRETFDSCLKRKDLAEAIYRIAKTAHEDFDVTATPTFFVNGERVRGAQDFATFMEIIDRKLAN